MVEKFSVLMSVYKNEKPDYLKATLKSLEKQTLLADEYVIVCDGPLTAELDSVIDEFQQKHEAQTSVHRFSENRGLGHSLADGVKLAKHEWIARMDTDDIAVQNRFELQMNKIQKNVNLQIIGGQISEFEDEPSNPISMRKVPITHQEILEFAKQRNPFNHMTVMYKKSAVLAAGNYLPLQGYEDYYLWVRMLVNGAEAYNLENILVYARAGEDMFKRRGGLNYYRNSVKAYNTIYRVGLATPKDWLVRNGGQLLVNLLTNDLRGKFYKKILRK